MASNPDLEQWFCAELSNLGIDITEENAQYILSIEDGNDLEDYMKELLDASDPKVRVFLQELKSRYKLNSKSDNIQVYRKNFEETNVTAKKKKKTRDPSGANNQLKTANTSLNNDKESLGSLPDAVSHLGINGHTSPSNGEIGVGAKRKSKYVPLYSKEGQAKTVIQLPGRYTCECQAAKHKLINNCTQCGRIVCEQEGAGPCVFCGNLVCTPEDQELFSKGTKKAEKRKDYLMKGGETKLQEGFERAKKHRDKLLEFDKNSVRRTQVIDDECDYYATDANRWLNKDDREKLRKREEELRNARHGSRRERKITFDFAGRRILDASEDAGKDMYNSQDSVIQEVQYGKKAQNNNPVEIFNPTIATEPPQWVEDPSIRRQGLSQPGLTHKAASKSSRIQDRELKEMSDEGWCLSLHQPLASFVVHGIMIHEGRTWYTPHRGRLWIAATAKKIDPEEIAEYEEIFRLINGGSVVFPTEYPSACLLGCVNLDDCLDQDEYRKQYPDGASNSPYVFICSNPQQLIVKFPIKGKHKIYKLEPQQHQAAKKGLR